MKRERRSFMAAPSMKEFGYQKRVERWKRLRTLKKSTLGEGPSMSALVNLEKVVE
jgi:hypothetical protein